VTPGAGAPITPDFPELEQAKADLANARAAGEVLLRERDKWRTLAQDTKATLDAVRLDRDRRLDLLTDNLRAAEHDHDKLIDALMAHMGESWDGDQGAESLVADYAEAVTARLRALVGEAGLARYPEDADGAPLPDAATEPDAYRAAVLSA
jgi:hypothetical protein